MKKSVIFDVDGTLADANHRLHFIKGDKDSGKRNWGAFFREAIKDSPYEHVRLMNHFFDDAGFFIYLITGRPSNLRKDTEDWLAKHNIRYDSLLMRPATDRRPDYESKKDLFVQEGINKDEVVCVFEDRLQVAKMWKELGLQVCVCGEDWLIGDWSK